MNFTKSHLQLPMVMSNDLFQAKIKKTWIPELELILQNISIS